MQVDIKLDPLYIKNSKEWFDEAQEMKELIFYKFFSLWCSFNALYNLVIIKHMHSDIDKIHCLVKKLSEEDASLILQKNKKECDFFFCYKGGPVIDMKKQLNNIKQPDDVENFKSYVDKYKNSNVENLKKILDISDILYRIRNNLTHGSKEFSGRDKNVIFHALPVLENLTQVIAEKVFYARS